MAELATIPDLDIAFLRGWIGRTAEAEDLITPRLVDSYRATFDPHLAPVGAGEAPLALHWCLAPAIAPMAELGPDGHLIKGEFLPPVPLPRRMWAGGEIEPIAPLTIGDRVAIRSIIDNVRAKRGRSGLLCFVTVRHEISTERGVAIRERHDIVYRDGAAGGPKESPAAPPRAARPAERTWRVDASPVLLFRYSALTFNGHRIHYDYPYVTGVEDYAGLLVHGPLQATLLLNLAAVMGGGAPALMRYRAVAPLIGGHSFEVEGARDGDRAISCWTRSAGIPIAMQGAATW